MSAEFLPRPKMHEPDEHLQPDSTPPGWYDDGQGRLTWWDGERWTGRHRELPAAASPAPRRGAPMWVAIVLPVVALAVGLAVGLAVD